MLLEVGVEGGGGAHQLAHHVRVLLRQVRRFAGVGVEVEERHRDVARRFLTGGTFHTRLGHGVVAVGQMQLPLSGAYRLQLGPGVEVHRRRRARTARQALEDR